MMREKSVNLLGSIRESLSVLESQYEPSSVRSHIHCDGGIAVLVWIDQW